MYNIAQILIILAGLLWAIELIPQLVKTYKSKSVEGISTSFFVICFIAYLLYIIGNGILKNWIIILAHIPSVIGILLMLIFIVKYRRIK